MEDKKIYTSLAAAALVLIAVFVIASRWPGTSSFTGNSNEPGENQVATSTPAGSINVEVVTTAESTDLYTVRAEHPRFESLPGLTTEIDSFVEGAIEQFTKTVKENDQARRDTATPGENVADFVYSLSISWKPAQINSRYVSLILHLDAFEGGANLRQEARTFNYDVQAKRAVTLSDLFPGEPGYLERVSTYTRQVLEGNLGENTTPDFLNEGTKPTLGSFEWFTFTDEFITFTFPKYQVAPGAAGEQTVTMPRNVEGIF